MNAMKLAVPLLVALAYGPSPALADPILGADLATFAVLGAETVTNVTPSVIFGNVGVWRTGGVNEPSGFNFTPGVAVSDTQVIGGGLVHAGTTTGTPNAESAQGQLTTARNDLSGLGSGTLLPADLVGLTIFPGVFTVLAGTTNLSGAVTLDGRGDLNAFWLFQTGALTTSSASVINVINTGTGAGIFWNDTSSVTLGSTTSFEGNILALTSIGLVTGATIGCGRALADVGSVTLQQNTIGIGCGFGTGAGSNGFSGSGLAFDTAGNVVVAAGAPQGGTGPGPGVRVSVPGQFVPEPGTLVLFGLGLAGLFTFRKRLLPAA